MNALWDFPSNQVIVIHLKVQSIQVSIISEMLNKERIMYSLQSPYSVCIIDRLPRSRLIY